MKKIIIFLLAGALFAACDNDDDIGPNEQVPIVLSSRLTVEVPRISRQDVQIADGQEVSLFVTRTGAIGDIAYNNARLTADGIGNFSYLYNSETTLYYPLYTNNVDFYAIHPYGNITLGSDYNFSIQPNQEELVDFLDSDLLYVHAEDIEKTRQPVRLVFDHKLAKVSFVILAGSGTDLTGLSSVEILNAQPEAVMNTADGGVTTGALSTVNVTTYGLADDTAETSASEVSGVAAIIPPQTFAANQPLFRITINGVSFTYTPSSEVTFATGTSYRYRLTLTGNVITVTSSINPWTPTEDTEGEGVITD